jgi:hypothetical protein
MSDATEERRRWVSFTHATPNYGVQATVVPLRSTAAPDTRRYVKKGKLSGKKIMTKAIKDRMVGVWELAEAKFETLDGNVIEPYGPSPLGLGIITENGYLERVAEFHWRSSGPLILPAASVSILNSGFGGALRLLS